MAGYLVIMSLTIAAITISTSHPVNGVAGQEVGVGVCYGQLGDNLPPPPSVVALYKQYNLNKMRIYQPDPAVLDALRGTGIQVIVGTYNSDVPVLAQSQAAAQAWFAAHIRPYVGTVNITYISVGNEVYPSQPSSLLVPAMQNLLGAVDGVIKVSTAVSMGVLQSTYPPSSSTFRDPEMAAISGFLQAQPAELLVNVYPYFPYASNPGDVRLDYARFTAGGVEVQDGALGYTNLFDAMVDSFYWAMEKAGAPNVGLVVSETGWPHGGASQSMTSVDLAATYNKGLVKHLQAGTGTPKRPNVYLQAFIFAMFDEDQKAAGVEQFWGLFKPSGQPNYIPF